MSDVELSKPQQEHAEQMAHLGWQYFECPACGSEGARAFPKPDQEPVIYQHRMRPIWTGVTAWSDWKECSKEVAADYIKTARLHDWEYEVRSLYTALPQREWVGLTNTEFGEIYDSYGTVDGAMAAVEDKLKEKNK